MAPTVERLTWELGANAAGIVQRVDVCLDGVLIALQTMPGTPGPTRAFDVVLLDAAGQDVLQGCGRQCSPTEKRRALVRLPKKNKRAGDRHPIVDGSERLQLRILPATLSGVVRISLFIGSDDGRVE